MLLVEHDIDRVFQIADVVTVMNEGAVLVDGSVEDARSNAKVREIYIGSGTARVAAEAAARARPSATTLLASTRSTRSTARATSSTPSSLDVHEHEIVALLGRNGAGKSTLLKTLIGIAPPEPGSIKLAGREIARLAVAPRSRGAASATCRRAGACSPA